ncbi:GNAT family protein [Lachnospiraceae bacterium 56-18]
MGKINAMWEKDGYILRSSEKNDAENYYQQNYNPLDPEVARLTGCKASFTRDEVVSFFQSCIDDENRYDFLIVDPDGQIIGESVINEINWDLRSANFRIGIFRSDFRGKGIGSWAIRMTCGFAFEQIHLHRLELDVFSFNPRAEQAYLKAGFKREGVLRDAVKDGDTYADDILMAMLEDEWKDLDSLRIR